MDSKFFKFCLYVLRCAWDKWNSERCLRTKEITKEAGSFTDYILFYIKRMFFTAFMQMHWLVRSRKKIQTPCAFRVTLLPLTTSLLKYNWFQQLEEPRIEFSASLPVSVDVKQNERDHCLQNKWCLTCSAAKNMHLLFLALLKQCIPHRSGKSVNWRNGHEKTLQQQQKHITETTMNKNVGVGGMYVSTWWKRKGLLEWERLYFAHCCGLHVEIEAVEPCVFLNHCRQFHLSYSASRTKI